MTYGLLRLHAKDSHEPRQACFLSTNGVFAIVHFSSMRGHSPRRSQGPGLHLHGLVLDHGLCSVDLPRVFARLRGQFARPSQAAVTLGAALQDRFSQHLGQCQCNSALANLRRLRATPDRHGAPSVFPRPYGDRLGCNRLRLRCHDDRPLSLHCTVVRSEKAWAAVQTQRGFGRTSCSLKLNCCDEVQGFGNSRQKCHITWCKSCQNYLHTFKS